MNPDHFLLPLGRTNQEHQVQAWYDTREGLEARLKRGLEGLWEIARARYEAGYQRKERMSTWCLMGVFWTDSCGNFSRIIKGAPADAYEFMPYEGPLPNVLSRQEVDKYTSEWTSSLGNGSVLPPFEGHCERCGRGWTLSNVRDFYQGRDEPPRHKECHRLMLIQREAKELGDILVRAEIPFSEIYLIPNEYGSDLDFYGPWIMVETPRGRLKMGWRKRVINIDWSLMGMQVTPETFASEEVTKWATGIHAWSSEKAVEYLRKIWSC